jgi:hypothetical protein
MQLLQPPAIEHVGLASWDGLEAVTSDAGAVSSLAAGLPALPVQTKPGLAFAFPS